MKSVIVGILSGSHSWGLDLYIWDYRTLDKFYKKNTYELVFDNSLLCVYNSSVNFDYVAPDYYIHYLQVVSIKIKSRINITINKTWEL